MQASIKWLKDYVDFSESPDEIAERLTRAGLEVESVRQLGAGIENVVTGVVTEIVHHTDADKLWICTIDIKNEKLIIVTGAQNVTKGCIVPVAKIGAKLPNGMKIKPSRLRGVDSCGMLCSAKELALDLNLLPPEAKEGIYLLPADTPVGIDIHEALGLDDAILDFELTANRADCFSMIGLAREIAVLTGHELMLPATVVAEQSAAKTAELVDVEIAASDLCPRFAARVMTDVKVGPSPLWLQKKIEASGMRPISNIVDVTNFVMMELGLPMHAYDYDKLSGHRLIARRAHEAEQIVTLDGQARQLTGDMLVIADCQQAAGVAGVMGGLATEVTADTKTIVLEAAAFNGTSIRRTGRALGLHSEASGRFERGVDVTQNLTALNRAAALLEEIGAAKACVGIVDVYPQPETSRQVTFTAASINARLGMDIKTDTMLDILQRLGFIIDSVGENITVTVPTWRNDVTGMADISEEIIQIYGFDKIPSTVPGGTMLQGGEYQRTTLADRLRSILTASGFDETINYSFTNPAVLAKLQMPAGDANLAISILNPITDEFTVMRTDLLPGIMETVSRNVARKNEDVQIFEIGVAFRPASLPLTDFPSEPLLLCGAMTGRRNGASWNNGNEFVDFYDAKGAVENILNCLGIRKYQFTAGEHPALHPGKTAVISCGRTKLGFIGELHPKVASAFGLMKKAYVFELQVDALDKLAAGKVRYQQIPKYPAIARDLALVLDEDITSAETGDVIRHSGGKYLQQVVLFDVYEGGQIEAGKKSLAYSLTFQAHDRTLRDEEVDAAVADIMKNLQTKLSAVLRS